MSFLSIWGRCGGTDRYLKTQTGLCHDFQHFSHQKTCAWILRLHFFDFSFLLVFFFGNIPKLTLRFSIVTWVCACVSCWFSWLSCISQTCVVSACIHAVAVVIESVTQEVYWLTLFLDTHYICVGEKLPTCLHMFGLRVVVIFWGEILMCVSIFKTSLLFWHLFKGLFMPWLTSLGSIEWLMSFLPI